MCKIIIVVLVLILIYTIHKKVFIYVGQPSNIIIPMMSFTDIKGETVEGAGMTPLTQPPRRACIQLMVANTQETTPSRQHDL